MALEGGNNATIYQNNRESFGVKTYIDRFESVLSTNIEFGLYNNLNDVLYTNPKSKRIFEPISKIIAFIFFICIRDFCTVQHTHGICLYFLFAHCFITPVRLMEVRYICVILVITVNDLRIYFIKYLFQDLPVL